MSNLPKSSPSQTAKLFAAKQREGSDVRNLLYFPEERVTRVIKSDKDGKKSKNYARRNMKTLRLKQEQFRKQCQEQQAQQRQEEEKDKKLKEMKFQHIKSRIFEEKTNEIYKQTSSSIHMFEKDLHCQSTLHKNYGHVPPYILRFRIEHANKENEHNLSLPNPQKIPEVLTNKHERMKVFQSLSMEEDRLTGLLTKMPFGIQSDNSVQKRKDLEFDLKRIRKEKSKLLT